MPSQDTAQTKTPGGIPIPPRRKSNKRPSQASPASDYDPENFLRNHGSFGTSLGSYGSLSASPATADQISALYEPAPLSPDPASQTTKAERTLLLPDTKAVPTVCMEKVTAAGSVTGPRAASSMYGSDKEKQTATSTAETEKGKKPLSTFALSLNTIDRYTGGMIFP